RSTRASRSLRAGKETDGGDRGSAHSRDDRRQGTGDDRDEPARSADQRKGAHPCDAGALGFAPLVPATLDADQETGGDGGEQRQGQRTIEQQIASLVHQPLPSPSSP